MISDNVIKTMMSLQDNAQALHLSRFFKTKKGQYGEGDLFLGIKVPVTRSIVKENWKNATLSDLEVLITSEWHEIRLCALLLLVQMYKHASKTPDQQKKYIEFYLSHTRYINNWDLVDLSCYEILGNWFLNKDRTLLYRLAKHGETLWEQRIGMVSCMTFVRSGEYKDALDIADILLHHSHDLIHKATGWVLREVGKHDAATLTAYLNAPSPHEMDALKPRYTVMPRTMLRYAIEKFDEALRQDYLKGRAAV